MNHSVCSFYELAVNKEFFSESQGENKRLFSGETTNGIEKTNP
jgi:hypothetical protein